MSAPEGVTQQQWREYLIALRDQPFWPTHNDLLQTAESPRPTGSSDSP